MFLNLFLLSQIIILLKIIKPSFEISYEYVFEDEKVFAECMDSPPGYSNISRLFDLTFFHTEMTPEGLHATGKLISSWDIQPTDRIEGRLSVLYLDRGTWQPTVLNMITRDFCKIYLDPKQFWYTCFPKYIINREEAEEKCFTHIGTEFVFEPFMPEMYFGVGINMPPGRKRIVITLAAVDLNNVTRPNGVCFEMRGEFYKVQKGTKTE
ncbi:uncharacterized protein CheB74a [Drosophila takahashii]|uniref:uncharacterized protein CheB74a n=1 Tax=Drosophila takahashii TaxID=29030 RepID=UPI001CF8BB46|nr:uncharacterized protein LOC108061639 [Drosophila takahashii]